MAFDVKSLSLRTQVGHILGEAVAPGKWEEKFRELSQGGRFDNKKVMAMLALILTHLEELERKEQDKQSPPTA